MLSKKAFLIAILAILCVLPFAGAFAVSVDDEGVTNDPRTNDRANACYEGSSLAGRCDTSDLDRDGTVEDWEIAAMWEGGWYYIRFEQGLITRSQVPTQFQWLLPPAPTPVHHPI